MRNGEKAAEPQTSDAHEDSVNHSVAPTDSAKTRVPSVNALAAQELPKTIEQIEAEKRAEAELRIRDSQNELNFFAKKLSTSLDKLEEVIYEESAGGQAKPMTSKHQKTDTASDFRNILSDGNPRDQGHPIKRIYMLAVKIENFLGGKSSWEDLKFFLKATEKIDLNRLEELAPLVEHLAASGEQGIKFIANNSPKTPRRIDYLLKSDVFREKLTSVAQIMSHLPSGFGEMGLAARMAVNGDSSLHGAFRNVSSVEAEVMNNSAHKMPAPFTDFCRKIFSTLH